MSVAPKVESLLFSFACTGIKAEVLYFYTINKDIRKDVIGLSFPISVESPQNVNMNDEHSSKTNQVLNSDLGVRALEDSLRGALFQLQLQLHPSRPAVDYEEYSSWRINVLLTTGTPGQNKKKVELTPSQPSSQNEITQSLTVGTLENKLFLIK